MKNFICINTKNDEMYCYSEKEIEKLFECDTFCEKYIYEKDYNDFLKSIDDEEEKQDFIENNKSEIISNKYNYLMEMIEYETWCHSKGVRPVFKVIAITDNFCCNGTKIERLLTDYISNSYVDFEIFGKNAEKVRNIFIEYEKDFNCIPCDEEGFNFEQQKNENLLEHLTIRKVLDLLY